MKKPIMFLLLLTTVYSGTLSAAMHRQQVVYQHAETTLKAYIFWDDAFEGKRPGVLVFHERWGMNDYPLLRAEMLAESGYVAMAADMYGDAVKIRQEEQGGYIKTHRVEDAGSWMQQVTSNQDQWRQRALLGFQQLLLHERVDPARTAAIGFSFGGASAMQLAYSGADIDAVIAVHANLPAASDELVRNIKARVLIINGASDPFVDKTGLDQLTAALNQAGVDWEINTYGGAKASFTNPYADSHGIHNMEYDETAEQRFWGRLLGLLDDVFALER